MKNLLYILFFLPVFALAQTMPRANTIRYTPSGFLSAINVQTAIDELEAEKARLIDGNATTAAGGTINMGGDAESSILIEGNIGLDFHVGNTTAFEDIKTEASDSTIIRSGTKIILESTTDDVDLIAADTVDISAPVVTFNKVPGTAGQVLTSDAAGGVSFEDPTGSGGGGASNRFPPNVQTGNYVFVALDTARMTIMRSVSNQTITVPPNIFTVGDMLQFYPDSTNVVTIVAGSGVSFTNSSGSLTCSQDDPVVLFHRSTNHWVIWKKSSFTALWGDIGGTLADQTDLQAALDAKQATLVSGTNIKTINGSTVLGSGDLDLNGAAANEVVKSDGTNFVSSDIFATAAPTTLWIGADGTVGSTYVKGGTGTSGQNNGAPLEFIAGFAYQTSGNGNGGNIAFSPGARRSAGSGTDGNTIFNTLQGWELWVTGNLTPGVLSNSVATFTQDVSGSAERFIKNEAGVVTQLTEQQQTLNVETTTVGNVTTGEDQLFSYTLPASRLRVNGQSIRARFSGTLAANGNTKTIKVKFGSTNIVNIAGTFTSVWIIDCEVIRTGAATQKCGCTTVGASAGLTHSSVISAAETLSGTVAIVVTGEGTSTDDIVKESGKIIFEP